MPPADNNIGDINAAWFAAKRAPVALSSATSFGSFTRASAAWAPEGDAKVVVVD
jgi:hypothetical protein